MLEPPSSKMASMRFSAIKRFALSIRPRRSAIVMGTMPSVIGRRVSNEGGACAARDGADAATAPKVAAADDSRNVRRLVFIDGSSKVESTQRTRRTQRERRTQKKRGYCLPT